MLIKARAKINWSLNVVGLRADGYHLLDMLTQRLALADELAFEVKPHNHGIQLHIKGEDRLAPSDDNLVLKAARALLLYTGHQAGVDISLTKNIPLMAGLGGGSADAAATLLALNLLWGLHLPMETLEKIGAGLGADVPLCLHEGLLRVGGIGELISPIHINPVYHLVVLKPKEGLITKQVFAAFDNSPDTGSANLERLSQALAQGKLGDIPLYAHNQLQKSAQLMMPKVHLAVEALYKQGAAYAQMTGAGSAVFGVFANESEAREAQDRLYSDWPICLVSRTV